MQERSHSLAATTTVMALISVRLYSHKLIFGTQVVAPYLNRYS